MRKILLFFIVFIFPLLSYCQVVYESSSSGPVYDLLDELASLKIISINSVARPYSRQYISEKLIEAKKSDQFHDNKITRRMEREILFYLKDYGFDLPGFPDDSIRKAVVLQTEIDPTGVYFLSQSVKASLNPVFGASLLTNENGNAWDISGGADFSGYAGKNFGFSAGIRQYFQSEILSDPKYFTSEEGRELEKIGTGGFSGTEWYGGLSVAWDWGDFGLYKNRPVWGNSINGSNILSGHAPSFPYIQLHLKPAKWFEFRYIHGWLKSEVIDSSASIFSGETGQGSNDKIVFRKKYIAANMLTVTPFRGLDISVGNSIIYSDVNPNPWYLLPFLFYNSVDAEKNLYNNDNGSNSQMFFDICSRQIRYLTIYTSLFIDELKVSRIFDPDQYNFTSWKAGLQLNGFPFKNLSFTVEWTKTNPITYKHYIPTTDFETDKYCLGHYLRDNSQEVFLSFKYKPVKNLSLLLSWTWAEHGPDYTYDGDTGEEVTTLPVLKNLTWKLNEISVFAKYEFINRVSVFLEYAYTNRGEDVKYSAPLFYGITNTMIVGISMGWE